MAVSKSASGLYPTDRSDQTDRMGRTAAKTTGAYTVLFFIISLPVKF